MDENFDLSKAIDTVQQMLSDENGENPLEEIIAKLTSQGGENSQTAENLLQNLIGKLTETENQPQDSQKGNGFDLSGLLSGMGGNDNEGFDINMLMKVQRIMSAVNQQKSNANSDFLKALKPFLKQERRQKLDNAIKIVNLTKILKVLKNDE